MNDNIIVKLIILISLLLLLLLLTKNASKFNDSLKNEKPLYNGDYWESYRLGDVVLQNINSIHYKDLTFYDNVMYHIEKFPNSIASKYLQKNNKNQNYDLLLEIINEVNIEHYSNNNNEILLTNSDLVLHIRIGDILCDYDKGNQSKDYSKLGDTDWWTEVIDYITDSKITKVYIISGAHYDKCMNESVDYLQDRINFLKNNNLNVEMITDKNPDETIIFCSKASHFITTGGQYGKLIGNIVKRQGGNFVLK